jgi:hypothetical protein
MPARACLPGGQGAVRYGYLVQLLVVDVPLEAGERQPARE